MRALILAALLIPSPAFAMQGDWIDRAIESMTDHRQAPQVRSYRKAIRPHKPKPKPERHHTPDNGAHWICRP